MLGVMAASDNLNEAQLVKQMKTYRTKIDNVETKYGAVDISPRSPLYAVREGHRAKLSALREQYRQLKAPDASGA